MNKLTVIFGLIAAASLALSAGLWFSRPEDSTGKLIALETKLRQAEATIAQMRKGTPSSGGMIGAGGAHGSATGAQNGFDASTGASASSAPGGPGSAVTAVTQNVAGAPVRNAGKADKRLAEAEARYADLINQFNLQPEEKEAFKDMLARRDDIRKDASNKLADPALNAQQRQAILAEAKTALDQVDSGIQQFLNSDQDYGTFQKWQNQELERAQMDGARAIFQNSGAPLSDEQQTWLVDQMWSLRRDTKGLGDPYYLETMAGVRIDNAYVQNSLNKFDADSLIMEQNARSQFTPPQLDALRSMRKQQRVQLESRLWNLSRTTNQ